MNIREKLLHRLTLVEILQFVCALLVFGPLIVFVLLILMLPASPESGFAGIGLIFGWGIWLPVLLIPLLGFFVAKSSAANLRQQIAKLSEESEKPDHDDAA